MARIKDNDIVRGASGKFGKQLVFRQRFGDTILAKPPRFSGELTVKQEEVTQKFRRASIYARAAITDPVIKQQYALKATEKQSAFNVAFADYFRAPEIGEIDASAYTGAVGSKVRMQVTDNFKVKAVRVIITQSGGALIEDGQALLDPDGLHWTFTATSANVPFAGSRIKVEATDLPGNLTVSEKILS